MQTTNKKWQTQRESEKDSYIYEPIEIASTVVVKILR